MASSAQDPKTSLHVFWKRFRVPIILGALSVICVTLSLVLLVKSLQPASPIQFFEADVAQESSNLSTKSANISFILVDVGGAVLQPGIVRLPAGSRVEDAIASAGGLRSDADSDYVSKNLNRAMKLVDGMKVYIPSMSHNGACATSHGEVAQSCGIIATPGKSSQNAAPVSINTASQSELESLPGVGPVTASKIITNRPYMSLNELVTKKAIGASLFEKLKNDLSL